MSPEDMTPEDRAWAVVRRAFEERGSEPRRPRASNRLLLAAVVALVAAVAVAALSPPGHAVFERVRRAVGIENAAPSLLSLPGGGKLLVHSATGGDAWIVDANGAKRDLGAFDDVAWSPHGLYLVATRDNELLALDPHGHVMWSLGRHSPAWPTWTGTRTDTRIAYQSSDGLHVVAGDGTDDHLLDANGGWIAAAWDPARKFTLAYRSRNAIVVRRDTGTLVWRHTISIEPSQLAWSSDGRYLAVVSPHRIDVLDARGHLRRTVSTPGTELLNAAFAPRTHNLAVVVRYHARSEVRLVDADDRAPAQVMFAGPGAFGDIAWSPNGKWLLVSWPAANQWVFLHGTQARAVANIRRQFPGSATTNRWCC